jgi:hypothetical protein
LAAPLLKWSWHRLHPLPQVLLHANKPALWGCFWSVEACTPAVS